MSKNQATKYKKLVSTLEITYFEDKEYVVTKVIKSKNVKITRMREAMCMWRRDNYSNNPVRNA